MQVSYIQSLTNSITNFGHTELWSFFAIGRNWLKPLNIDQQQINVVSQSADIKLDGLLDKYMFNEVYI